MRTDLFSLTGRRALITGSTKGIGSTIARGFAEAGATVILNGRDEDRLAHAVAVLRDAGHDAHGSAFDVTDPVGVEEKVELIEGSIGPLDIVVNNAGIQLRQPIADWTPEQWHRVIDADLTSAWLVSRAVGLRMVERGHGKIINICSVQSELGRPSIVPYTAAKGGLKMLTKGLCAEWAGKGLQINAIAPGYFDTELTSALVNDPVFDGWLRARTPAGRWGKPEELIGAAVFFASPASDFVNGQMLVVDGGMVSVV